MEGLFSQPRPFAEPDVSRTRIAHWLPWPRGALAAQNPCQHLGLRGRPCAVGTGLVLCPPRGTPSPRRARQRRGLAPGSEPEEGWEVPACELGGRGCVVGRTPSLSSGRVCPVFVSYGSETSFQERQTGEARRESDSRTRAAQRTARSRPPLRGALVFMCLPLSVL